ncbi:hypothetical protein BBP40_010432 [Aspergillus hancockii]|nr:hypothetical protein BBP40_010432 [Aspergillus hancockii]
MDESQAKIIKLQLSLFNKELGRLIRCIENHAPSKNTLTVTFAQKDEEGPANPRRRPKFSRVSDKSPSYEKEAPSTTGTNTNEDESQRGSQLGDLTLGMTVTQDLTA